MKQNKQNHKSKQKRVWTEEEDQLVIRLVEEYGPQKWTLISQQIEGRIGKQCRERWHNHLNPNINKAPWEPEEEWLLFLYHKAISNKWAEISKHIKGRTDNSIKNHWNSGMKKKMAQFQQKLIQIKQKFQTDGTFEGYAPLEKKALEIILLNKEYEVHPTDSSQYSGSQTKKARKKLIEEKDEEEIQFELMDEEERIYSNDSNEVNYFQTPAAFYKKKKIKLGNSDKIDQWGQEHVIQNLFA